jgi:hypothetical protein
MQKSSQRIGIVGILCLLGLSGCMSTSGYGTFDGDNRPLEQQILGNMFGVLGLQGGKQKPQHQFDARAPLVVPPDEKALPQPKEQKAIVNNPNWPVDQTTRKIAKDDRVIDDKDNSKARLSLKQLALQAEPVEAKRVALEDDPTRKGYYTDGGSVRLTRQQMKEQDDLASLLKKKQELGPDGLPLRKYLTDPPKHLRVPSNMTAYQNPTTSDSWQEKSDLQKERGYRDSGLGGSGL